jgi:predicted TIM-barrel fold metal-dependent hydrolase
MRNKSSNLSWSRRDFLAASATTAVFSVCHGLHGADAPATAPEPIIDIHQHTHYHARTDEQLLAHQRAMGVTRTILLPAGREVQTASTHNGKSNGLAAQCGGNETVVVFSKAHPTEFVYGSNEVSDLPEARAEIEKYLKLGAVIIGEQKFSVPCDSRYIESLAELAQEYRVPILQHFQHETYNLGFERFYKMLEKYPKVIFIGHAQTWWANIDKDHSDQKVLYPKTKVTPGGLTDRYLHDYPNMYADMSAGSGLNALIRDEEHTRWFLERHQNKILYGSDCNDALGRGPGCQGAQTIAALRRLCPTKAIERKILFENSKKVFRF